MRLYVVPDQGIRIAMRRRIAAGLQILADEHVFPASDYGGITKRLSAVQASCRNVIVVVNDRFFKAVIGPPSCPGHRYVAAIRSLFHVMAMEELS